MARDLLDQRIYTSNTLLQLDRLILSQAGSLAQKRLARGVKLNHSEAVVSAVPLVSINDTPNTEHLI